MTRLSDPKKKSGSVIGYAGGSARLKRGGVYLAGTVAVIFSLSVLFPDVLGLDLRGIMSSERVVGALRCALGAAIILCLVVSLFRVARTFSLEGETLLKGLSNAVFSQMLGRDALVIVLGLLGGAALVVWGIAGLLG